jgi:hypothetical protein
MIKTSGASWPAPDPVAAAPFLGPVAATANVRGVNVTSRDLHGASRIQGWVSPEQVAPSLRPVRRRPGYPARGRRRLREVSRRA